MKTYTYLIGTIIAQHGTIKPDREDDIMILLDKTPKHGPWEKPHVFIFDRIPSEDNFPFDLGDKVEVVIRTIED